MECGMCGCDEIEVILIEILKQDDNSVRNQYLQMIQQNIEGMVEYQGCILRSIRESGIEISESEQIYNGLMEVFKRIDQKYYDDLLCLIYSQLMIDENINVSMLDLFETFINKEGCQKQKQEYLQKIKQNGCELNVIVIMNRMGEYQQIRDILINNIDRLEYLEQWGRGIKKECRMEQSEA